jgi:hypothetical protein
MAASSSSNCPLVLHAPQLPPSPPPPRTHTPTPPTHTTPPHTPQLFWRGFFLASLTKVLPLPACVALSSATFAALHLSPHNLAPLLALSACCDLLYLRSGANLLPPLLFHAAWNGYQVLAIALLGKDSYV